MIRQQLYQIEQQLREMGQWQALPPDEPALSSQKPFCLDTLTPYQWLQWILLPRLHALLDAQQPLPSAFAIAPYFEVMLTPMTESQQQLLLQLKQLDRLVALTVNTREQEDK